MAILSKGAKKYPPIKFRPDDPENKFLSKAQFIEKRKKQKEAELEAERAYMEAMAPKKQKKAEAEEEPMPPKKTKKDF